MMAIKPKVSVCVVTYNQEKYIRQCLQSLVDQETDFYFEVIVSDDCSTDKTGRIVKEFADKHPEVIKAIIHNKNIGAYKNFLFVHEQAGGEYIAHMDGDDYALPGKLKFQADYLDSHSECNIVWHRMLLSNETTGVIAEDLIDVPRLPKCGFFRHDVLRYITIGLHSSKMYRSICRRFDLPNFPVVDYFANVEQIASGCANFIGDKPLGVYRVGIGIAHSNNVTNLLLQNSFIYFSNKYPCHKREICTAALLLALSALKNFRWVNCYLYSCVALRTFRFYSFFDLWKYRSVFRMLRIPRIVR